MKLETLKKIPLFAGLTDQDFNRLCEMSEEIELAAGEVLFEEGTPGTKAYAIESGLLEVLKDASGRDVLLALRGPGEIIGEVALLDEAPRMASVKARTDSVLLAIGKESFDDLLRTSTTALFAIYRTYAARLRSTQTMLQQSEKMAQLGTLTAGIAHELNNPIAAIQRGDQQLTDAVTKLLDAQSALDKMDLTTAQKEQAASLRASVYQKASAPPNLDALARSDLAEEIEQWLHNHQSQRVSGSISNLVDLDFSVSRLNELAGEFHGEQLVALLNWLGANYAVQNLLAEIDHSAKRVSEIVKALKSYIYLDQAPIQSVDLKAGIEDTLLILGSKLRPGVSVIREYADALPNIQAYGSELNQVWTNIIDNAVDAMGGKGEIRIRTKRDGDWAVVEIEDNGPGIPVEIQNRIFDVFFTTKPIGKGTGLGLSISYNVVVHKHSGDIRLYSKPGQTRFEVWLPIGGNSTKAAVPNP
ncbi:MAG: ATP-binding protein [Anaerolineales bacterium]